MNSFINDCRTCKIKNCSILKNCGDQILQDLTKIKISKSLRANKQLFTEGDPVMGVYFIKKGLVKIELNGKNGRPLLLKIQKPGSLFGHRINQHHTHHSFSVTTVMDTEYCFIPSYAFSDLLHKTPSLQNQMLNQLLDDLNEAEQKSITLAHRSVKEKVADAIIQLANLYDYSSKKLSFRIHFCRQDIADFTGTTKEQVSKTLNQFEKENLIKCKAKRFTYVDMDSLMDIACLNNPQIFSVA